MTKSQIILLPLLLLAAAFAMYGPALGHSFQLDDTTSIVENPSVRRGDLRTAVEFWPGRSLVYLSFALQLKLSGLSPSALRAVNVASHALASAALAWLLYGLLHVSVPGRDPRIAAALAALFFLLHPIQTQSVTYIVQRATTWAAMFSLLALALQAHSWRNPTRQRSWRALSFACAIAAMFCKEWAAVLPLVMILAELLFGPKNSWRRQLAPALLLLLVVPLTATLGTSFGDAGADSLLAETTRVSRQQYFQTQFEVLHRYVGLIAWPLGQNIDHDIAWHDDFVSTLPWTLGPALLLSIALVALRRNHRLSAFAILAAIIFALPESSLFPILDPMFEHRVYMSMFGVSILFALACDRLIRTRRRTGWILASIVLALLAWRTVERNQVWESPETLWRDSVAKSPQKSRPHLGLGVALAQRGEFDAALLELETAVRLRPTSAAAWTNLGNIQLSQGDLDAAIGSLEQATVVKSGHAAAWYNLGVALNRRGNYPAARDAFAKAAHFRPQNALAWNGLASVQLRLGDRRGAGESARRAAALGSPVEQLLRATE